MSLELHSFTPSKRANVPLFFFPATCIRLLVDCEPRDFAFEIMSLKYPMSSSLLTIFLSKDQIPPPLFAVFDLLVREMN